MASISIDRVLAASPVTVRGQPTQLSADPKGQRIAYAVSGTPFPPLPFSPPKTEALARVRAWPA